MVKAVLISIAMVIGFSGCSVAYQCINPMGTDAGIVICEDVKVLKGIK